MTTTKPRAGIRLSVAEFLDLPDTDDKCKMELDAGELYLMPRPRLVHNFRSLWLAWHILNYLQSFPEPPADLFQDVIVDLFSDGRYLFAPDLTIVLREREAILGNLMVAGAPDIAVEVLSEDRNRDLVHKRQVYAQAGVLEYWPIDSRSNTVTQLELRDGAYVERAGLGVDDLLTTPLLPGLSIPLGDIFRHRRRPPRDE